MAGHEAIVDSMGSYLFLAREHARRRRVLIGELGGLAGTAITISGRPSAASYAMGTTDPASGKLEKVWTGTEDGFVVALTGVALLGVSQAGELTVSVVAPNEVEALATVPGRLQGYRFPLEGIESFNIPSVAPVPA